MTGPERTQAAHEHTGTEPMAADTKPHSESYIDNEGEERCSTCDKWLEPGYYTIEDHQRATTEA